MHTFLVTGGTSKKRQMWIADKLREWKIGAFDKRELRPEEASIGISLVRQFQHSLITAPSVGIIWQAERLTIEAQNALLTTLEEPPKNTRLMLESSSADTLLSTIISRCHLTDLGSARNFSDDELELWQTTWDSLGRGRLGENLKLLDAIASSREEALRFVDCGIETLHRRLDLPTAAVIRILLRTRIQLSANVTPKLALDTLVMSVNYSIMMST